MHAYDVFKHHHVNILACSSIVDQELPLPSLVVLSEVLAALACRYLGSNEIRVAAGVSYHSEKLLISVNR